MTSSGGVFLVAKAYPAESRVKEGSRDCTEFTRSEVDCMNLSGLPMFWQHERERGQIGTWLGSYVEEDGSKMAIGKVEPDKVPSGDVTRLKHASLGHYFATTRHGEKGPFVSIKIPTEISVGEEEPERPGCHVFNLFKMTETTTPTPTPAQTTDSPPEKSGTTQEQLAKAFHAALKTNDELKTEIEALKAQSPEDAEKVRAERDKLLALKKTEFADIIGQLLQASMSEADVKKVISDVTPHLTGDTTPAFSPLFHGIVAANAARHEENERLRAQLAAYQETGKTKGPAFASPASRFAAGTGAKRKEHPDESVEAALEAIKTKGVREMIQRYPLGNDERDAVFSQAARDQIRI